MSFFRKKKKRPNAQTFSTHASAIADIKCRFLFMEEETGEVDCPSRGWSEVDILRRIKGAR